MGQLAELFIVGILIVGGIYIYKHPEIIDQIKAEIGNIGGGGGNTGGNTNTEETGGNTNKDEEEEEKEEPKKKSSKFVAVYSDKPRTYVRTPATIY